MPYARRRRNARRKPRPNMRRNRRRRQARKFKRMAIMAGETKLLKNIQNVIDHGTTLFNTSHVILTPYAPQEVSGGSQSNWTSLWNVAPTNSTATFITQGTSFQQRIGRKVTVLNTNTEIHLGLVSAYPAGLPAGNVAYPNYPVLRVVQGWVKKGWEHLMDLQIDCPNLYSEITYTKYKILRDKTYTFHAMASTAFGGASTFDGEDSNYRPLKLRHHWSPRRPLTFAEVATSGLSTSNGAYEGWCPFLMILNPQHGVNPSSLQLDITYARRLLTFKDA